MCVKFYMYSLYNQYYVQLIDKMKYRRAMLILLTDTLTNLVWDWIHVNCFQVTVLGHDSWDMIFYNQNATILRKNIV